MNDEIFAAELIKQFSGIWPSLRSTMRPDDILQYEAQMITALKDNGLNTPEAIKQGFRKARTEGGQYPPSVPEFLKWCKVEKKEQCHNLLPKLNQLECSPSQKIEFVTEMREAIKGIK